MCSACLCIVYGSHTLVFFSGVATQETEEGCQTEATTPTSFEPLCQTQMSTTVLDESAPEEVTSPPEEVGRRDQDISPAEEADPKEEESNPIEAESHSAQPKEERDCEKKEVPEGSTDSECSQSVDALLADWQEDLEAFQQMEKDEL